MPIDCDCPICGKYERFVIPYRGRAKLPVQPVICKQCGLVFINPMYLDAEKEAAAPCPRALHRPVRFGHTMQRAHDRQLRGARRFMDFVRPHLKPGDRVLDIGCGDGALVRLLQAAGAVPTGVDLDPEAARFIQAAYGIPVVLAPFEQAELPMGGFDAVVATHVIEHFFAPLEALTKMRRLLKPGGLLVLETPNIFRPKVGFHRLFSVPHNFYFSPRTLCLAMQRTGFAPVAVREFQRDSFLVAARAVGPAAAPPAGRGDAWATVAHRVLHHNLRYKLSLQFLWRKIPGLKFAVMYRVHRNLTGPALAAWLNE